MKYIIEFENKIYMDDDGKEWYKVVNHPYWLVSKDMVGKLIPYAESKDEKEKEKDQILVGDEVKFADNSRAVVTFVMPKIGRYVVMWEDGLTEDFVDPSAIQKTGKHFDTFDKLLREMNKNE